MAYLKKIYAEMGVKNDPPHEYFKTDSRFMMLERTLRSLAAGKFCDLGCGRGLLLRRVQDHHVCYGTDFDEGAVAYCQSQGLKVEQLDLNEASELPFAEVTFDLIVISEVLEEWLSPLHAIQVA